MFRENVFSAVHTTLYFKGVSSTLALKAEFTPQQMLTILQELSEMRRDNHRCVPQVSQVSENTSFYYCWSAILDDSELNYSSTYKYNLEEVHIFAPDNMETKAASQMKDDKQKESDRYCIFCTSEFVGFHSH